jgi:hypothetical protein
MGENAHNSAGVVSWRASPLRARRGLAAVGALAILGLSALVGFIAGDVLWGVLSAAVLAVVTLDAWVPVRYVADHRELRMHGALRSRRVRWTDVRSVATEADGAFLSLGRGGVTVLTDSPARGEWLRAQVARAREVAS